MGDVNVLNEFQSTLSVRRATVKRNVILLVMKFQSTLSVRRATELWQLFLAMLVISIHALRKESDLYILY